MMRPLADCLCASDAAGRGGVRARVFVCLNSAPMGSIRNHQGKRDVQHRRDGLGGGVDHGIIESPCLGKCMHSDSIPGGGRVRARRGDREWDRNTHVES
jgi:hypothetical protein